MDESEDSIAMNNAVDGDTNNIMMRILWIGIIIVVNKTMTSPYQSKWQMT